jgi:probable addiction module antidote protein
MKREEDYKADLLADLRDDPDYVAGYLSAAKADSKEAFLVALRNVAEAQKGMKKVAKEARVNRENLYRALSKSGNPSISTLDSVLNVLGIETQFVVKKRATTTVATRSSGSTSTGSTIDTAVASTGVGKTHFLLNAVVAQLQGVFTEPSPTVVPFYLLTREEIKHSVGCI